MNVSTRKTESVTNRTTLAFDKLQKLVCRWLTSDEQQLVDRANQQSNKNADAATLYILYTDYGFTAEQLKELIQKFKEKFAYIEGNAQAYIQDLPEVQKLKDIGVDLDVI